MAINNNDAVGFSYLSQSTYNNFVKGINKPDDFDTTVFFTKDTKRLYLGAYEYSRDISVGSGVPNYECVPGSLYIMYDGNTNYVLYCNVSGASSGWIEINPKKLLNHISNTGNPHKVTKSQVGLGNVDNTSDENKPVSKSQAAAIKVVQDDITSHKNDKNNPHKVTKSQVGLGNVTNDAQVKRSELGAAGGVAELDETGKVPASQLPSYVDDVLEGYLQNNKFYSDSSHTDIITAESSKIYVNLHNDRTYRWSGTQYVEVSQGVTLGETPATAYRGDRGKTAYDHSQLKSGNPHGVTKEDLGLDQVDNNPTSLPADLYVTDNVGAYKSGQTIKAGTPYYQIFENMMSVEQQPKIVRSPYISKFTLTGTNSENLSGTEFEAGTPITVSWNIGFNSGSYSYKSSESLSPINPVSGTGVQVVNALLTAGGGTLGNFATGLSGSRDIMVTDSGVSVTASVEYSAGYYALTNKNNIPTTDVRIPAGSDTEVASITSYRKMFFGTHLSTTYTSDSIRSMSGVKVGADPHEFTIPANSKNAVLAVPQGYTPTIEMYELGYADYTSYFVKQSSTVSVAGANNYTPVAYDLYIYTFTKAPSSDTLFRVTLTEN